MADSSSSNSINDDQLCQKYPLHEAVFRNDLPALIEAIENKQNDINSFDIHGRSPLMLAVMLNHEECALHLLKIEADADTQNSGI